MNLKGAVSWVSSPEMCGWHLESLCQADHKTFYPASDLRCIYSHSLVLGQEAKLRTIMHCLHCSTLHYIVIHKRFPIIKQMIRKPLTFQMYLFFKGKEYVSFWFGVVKAQCCD